MKSFSLAPIHRISLALAAILALAPGCSHHHSSPNGKNRVPASGPEASPSEARKTYVMTYERGVALASTGDWLGAIEQFEAAVKLDDKSVEAHLGLGACYETLGNPLRAVAEYRRILELDPDSADAYANLGTSYIKLYHRERNDTWRTLARDAWKRSLALNSQQSDVRMYLADLDRRR